MLNFVRKNKKRILKCPMCSCEFKTINTKNPMLLDYECSCGSRWAIKVDKNCISYFHLDKFQAVRTTA